MQYSNPYEEPPQPADPIIEHPPAADPIIEQPQAPTDKFEFLITLKMYNY